MTTSSTSTPSSTTSCISPWGQLITLICMHLLSLATITMNTLANKSWRFIWCVVAGAGASRQAASGAWFFTQLPTHTPAVSLARSAAKEQQQQQQQQQKINCKKWTMRRSEDDVTHSHESHEQRLERRITVRDDTTFLLSEQYHRIDRPCIICAAEDDDWEWEVHYVYAENVDATTNVNDDYSDEWQSRQMVTAVSTE